MSRTVGNQSLNYPYNEGGTTTLKSPPIDTSVIHSVPEPNYHDGNSPETIKNLDIPPSLGASPVKQPGHKVNVIIEDHMPMQGHDGLTPDSGTTKKFV